MYKTERDQKMKQKLDWQWAFDNDLTILRGEDLFEDMLNETYSTVSICGYEYDAGRALKEIDPVAFRTGCADYIDSLVSEGEIFELSDGTLIQENPEDVLESEEVQS